MAVTSVECSGLNYSGSYNEKVAYDVRLLLLPSRTKENSERRAVVSRDRNEWRKLKFVYRYRRASFSSYLCGASYFRFTSDAAMAWREKNGAKNEGGEISGTVSPGTVPSFRA